jgi:hypothetical protein
MPKKSKSKGQRRPMKRRNNKNHLRTPQTKVWNQFAQPLPAQSGLMKLDNQVYRVRQIVELNGILTSSAGAGVSQGLAFNLAQLPQVSSWTSVFDQYRIDAIELWITPTQATTTATPDGWRWYSAIDYDDDGTSITEAAIQQYTNVSDCNRMEAVYRKFRPHIEGAVNASGSAVLAQNIPSAWIDSANTIVKHFGLKLYMQATVITVLLGLRMRFHVSFKNVF